MILIGFGGLIGAVTLIYVLRVAFSRQSGEMGGWQVAGARQIITAIARTTIAEGMRTRIASGFMLIILAIPVWCYLNAEGDGTIKGRVQMYMTYTMGISSFALSLLSVLFACRSLSKEIADRQIFGIASKPVPRWQILIGKFSGVMFLNVLLLAYVGVTTYAGTIAIVSQFKFNLRQELVTFAAFTPQQAEAAVAALDTVTGVGKQGEESPIITAMSGATGLSRDKLVDTLIRLPENTRADLRRFDEVRRQVLTSRASIKPTIPEEQIRAEVEKRLAQMAEEGTLPSHMSDREIREELDRQMYSSYTTIGPLGTRAWSLKGPPPPEDRKLIMSVRYKMHVPQTLEAINHPTMGFKIEEDTLLCIWGVGNPLKSTYYENVDAVPARTVQEMEFPVDAVEPDGTIRLEFANIDPRRVDVVFDVMKDAIEVLYVVGSFESNMAVACAAVLIPLGCLTAFGVCASTFLSFPVGALFVLCLFLISASMGFIRESMAITEDYVPEDAGIDVQIRRMAVNSIGWLLSIGDISVTDSLMDGRAIGWRNLWSDAWRYLLVKTGATLLVAVLIFRRRELASIVV